MHLSVILCTYNRCGLLTAALESLAASQVDSSLDWEVLVVDNNSKDHTREVVAQSASKFSGRFRYIFEPVQGKSNALNTGIRESQGDILAFVDDDVVAEPTWLQNLTAPLRDPAWAGVGGRIAPPRNFTPPRWLALEGPYELGGILALFDKGPDGTELTEAPFGTNMAYRRHLFEKYGLFRPDLGPCPGTEIRGEDTEFGRRVLQGGDHLWYEPSAVVHHAVPENRLRKDYFLRFLYDHGRAAIRAKEKGEPILFIPRLYFTIPKIVMESLLPRTLAWLCSFDPQRRFQRKCMVWMNIGQIAEICTILSGRSSSNSQPMPAINGKHNLP